LLPNSSHSSSSSTFNLRTISMKYSTYEKLKSLESKGSLPCSKEPAIVSYPESDASSPHLPTQLSSHLRLVLPRHIHFPVPRLLQRILQIPRPCVTFHKKLFVFYGEKLLSPLPILDDYPLSAVRDCIFNIFAATLRIWRPSFPSATRGRSVPWWQGPT
jgi:hypothetical protein